jgi:AcrR family transcriptional regulator
MAKPHNPESLALPLSRERILRCALSFADEKGIESLSMRKLAQALGVQAMSLYNHVTNKDDILDGIVDLVVGEISVPDQALDWKIAMQRRSRSAYQVLLRHSWATMLLMSRINVGPAMLRYIDATLGCLMEAGFSDELADHAWNVIDSHIYGFTLQELNFPIEATEYAKMAGQFIDQIPATRYPYMNRLTQQVIEGKYDGLHDFEFGLDLLLDALDSLRAKK